MSLKAKTIIAICISIVLVGLAVLVWAYQTGKIIIFGSQQTSNVTFQVKGADLNKGTADDNIDLSADKIKLKQNQSQQEAKAYLSIFREYTNPGDATPRFESIQEPFFGLGYSGWNADNWDPNNPNLPSNLISNPTLNFLTLSHNQSQPLFYGFSQYPDGVVGINPQVKFLTSDGMEIGELFFDFNGTKEKYLGMDIFEYNFPLSFNYNRYTRLNLIGIDTNQPYQLSVHSYIIGERHNVQSPAESSWYIEKIRQWQTAHPEIKVVVAKDKNSENLGTPSLVWTGENKGTYWGDLKMYRLENYSSFGEGILTATDFLSLKTSYNTDYDKVIIKPIEYPDQGIYQYSTGNPEITKFNTFLPLNQILPESSKITYRFAGSTDNENWSEWNNPIKEGEYQNSASGELRKRDDGTYHLFNESLTGVWYDVVATSDSGINLDNYIGRNITAYGNQVEEIETAHYRINAEKIVYNGGAELSEKVNLDNYIPSDSKYFKVEISLSKGTDTPSLEGFEINYDINGTVPDNTDPNEVGQITTSETPGTSNITTLVSTGSLLWVNILIALIFGGLITWLLVRKPSK